MLQGKTNSDKIWNFLYDNIKNPYGVAGLMGNLYSESGLNPINLQNTFNKSLHMTDDQYTISVDNGDYKNFIHDGAGYGLAQWTYWSRKQNLLNYAKAKNKSIGDLEMQLNFLWGELQGYTSVLRCLKEVASVREASDIVLLQFEKPANTSEAVQRRRAAFGAQYYDTYASIPSYYRVQCGAFSKEDNACQLANKLKQDGFETIIKFIAPYYRVQCGAFKQETHAKLLQKELASKGYNTIITYC